MLTETEMVVRLLAAHNAYVAKRGEQPTSCPALSLDLDGVARVQMYAESYSDSWHLRADSAREVLDELDARIAALPSEADRLRNAAAKAIADAIEACRAAGYPADFINPLTEISRRISENAITSQEPF